MLVHLLVLCGVVLIALAVTAGLVIGFGHEPNDNRELVLVALSVAAAVITALLFGAARERLLEKANRLVHGEQRAPDDVLRTFGSTLSRAIPLDELLLQLAESLKKTLALTRAEVWTGSPELLERTVSVPFAEPVKMVIGDAERSVLARGGISGQAWAAMWLPALLQGRDESQLRIGAAVHAGELLGLLVLERAADGDLFTEEDDSMLAALARQVALALHNVQLDSALQATLDEVRSANEELRASRARVVASGDAERRRIERDIHDGAQQNLVALAVSLSLIKDVVNENPAVAANMIEQLSVDVKETIGELRAIAHGIFPPLLTAAGLGEALRAAAQRSPLTVFVETDDGSRYGDEIESAIYFCCLEALQNAAKHAPAARVHLRVWKEDRSVRFEVADDGPGFDTRANGGGGQGFMNMSDRLGAIGGSVRWDSEPGAGTRISGEVPVA